MVYTEETLQEMAEILRKKEQEFKTDIYLVSDEPYRELVYDDVKEIFLTKYYHNTIVGYSFSKSLSLPGERIGYVAVPDEVADAENVIAGLEVSNRTLGFVNAPSQGSSLCMSGLCAACILCFSTDDRKIHVRI